MKRGEDGAELELELTLDRLEDELDWRAAEAYSAGRARQRRLDVQRALWTMWDWALLVSAIAVGIPLAVWILDASGAIGYLLGVYGRPYQ